jgi:hypothetical protein
MTESGKRALAIIDLSASKFGTTTKRDLENSIHVRKGDVSVLKDALKIHK